MTRATAKVTSKGQITVPAEIRSALGIHTGDVLVFEVKAGYAVASRQESLREVSDRLAANGPVAPTESVSDDQAVASLFEGETADDDGTLYVARRKA